MARIGLVVAFNSGWIILTGGWLILVISYSVRKLPFNVRASSAIVYHQIVSFARRGIHQLGRLASCNLHSSYRSANDRWHRWRNRVDLGDAQLRS